MKQVKRLYYYVLAGTKYLASYNMCDDLLTVKHYFIVEQKFLNFSHDSDIVDFDNGKK